MEFRYRCAQTFVFGLPVLALEWLGPRLGGPESARWIGLLQSLLCGWIVYVAAAGMVFEGIVLLRQRISPDLVVGVVAVLAYLWSVGAILPIFFTGQPAYEPTLFHLIVPLLLIWTGIRWWWTARQSIIRPDL
jgi:hypothetical protein